TCASAGTECARRAPARRCCSALLGDVLLAERAVGREGEVNLARSGVHHAGEVGAVQTRPTHELVRLRAPPPRRRASSRPRRLFTRASKKGWNFESFWLGEWRLQFAKVVIPLVVVVLLLQQEAEALAGGGRRAWERAGGGEREGGGPEVLALGAREEILALLLFGGGCVHTGDREIVGEAAVDEPAAAAVLAETPRVVKARFPTEGVATAPAEEELVYRRAPAVTRTTAGPALGSIEDRESVPGVHASGSFVQERELLLQLKVVKERVPAARKEGRRGRRDSCAVHRAQFLASAEQLIRGAIAHAITPRERLRLRPRRRRGRGQRRRGAAAGALPREQERRVAGRRHRGRRRR
uniref:Uncharacterized protein n=1 Tax=Oryza brachyantha TaxID=4533 RepID=J3LNF0_ORYBR